MKKWIWAVAVMAIVAFSIRPASAGIFDDIVSGVNRKKADKRVDAFVRQFRFVVYLTTGDVLKAVEYKGTTGGRKKGSFRFISNFESDIDVRTSFVKYIDMDNIGDQTLEEEYVSSRSDRVYLKNADYLTGKIVGFTSKDVLITTTYGDLKAAIPQVRYLIFRNPSTTPEFMMPAGKEPAKPAAAAPATPASEMPAAEEK